MGINLPLLNRARLFMHKLQNDKNISWDSNISDKYVKEWRAISKQFNCCPKISIDRSFGKRTDSYKLVGFTDSSGQIYGTVIYLFNNDTEMMSFALAKNRIVNKAQQQKSIPTLELQAVAFGTETLIDVFENLSGSDVVVPIKITNIELYTDNSSCLAWIRSYNATYDKMNSKSVYVRNRLDQIYNLCRKVPTGITFGFVSGTDNPADVTTRSISYNLLMKSIYLNGYPLDKIDRDTFAPVKVPSLAPQNLQVTSVAVHEKNSPAHLFNFDRFSKFSSLCNVGFYVYKFVNNLKEKICLKRGDPLTIMKDSELRQKALKTILIQDQAVSFPEVLDYFSRSNRGFVKDIPPLIHQLNLFMDSDGILKVKAKFKNWSSSNHGFPVLLHKNSVITHMVVRKNHEKIAHGGVYAVLGVFRKSYFLQHCFSALKKILKSCIICRVVNGRTVRLSQNSYRDFRVSPAEVPFRSLFLDFMGPIAAKVNGEKVKVYILVISCLWCRGINLKVCRDLSAPSFLRALQLHCFEWGVPQLILSDSGSQLVSAGRLLNEYLNDDVTKVYFSENNVQSFEYKQYPKGCNKLGGLVESAVKLVKRLLHGSVRNNVLDFPDLEYLVCYVVHLVNRRPLTFKESLRQSPQSDLSMPFPITPEILMKGHELLSVNVIPHIRDTPDDNDPDWETFNNPGSIKNGYERLNKCREVLLKLYRCEFTSNLMAQSTNVRGRYKPVSHENLKCGDLVLLKEPLLKQTDYPRAIITDLGEK